MVKEDSHEPQLLIIKTHTHAYTYISLFFFAGETSFQGEHSNTQPTAHQGMYYICYQLSLKYSHHSIQFAHPFLIPSIPPSHPSPSTSLPSPPLLSLPLHLPSLLHPSLPPTHPSFLPPLQRKATDSPVSGKVVCRLVASTPSPSSADDDHAPEPKRSAPSLDLSSTEQDIGGLGFLWVQHLHCNGPPHYHYSGDSASSATPVPTPPPANSQESKTTPTEVEEIELQIRPHPQDHLMEDFAIRNLSTTPDATGRCGQVGDDVIAPPSPAVSHLVKYLTLYQIPKDDRPSMCVWSVSCVECVLVWSVLVWSVHVECACVECACVEVCLCGVCMCGVCACVVLCMCTHKAHTYTKNSSVHRHRRGSCVEF